MGVDNQKQRKGRTQSNAKSISQISACARCGTCCRKGGPSFHKADRQLIEKGTIPSNCLYTIRQDEFAYDNIRGCLQPADTDIIKLKGQKGSWTCLFFDEKDNACRIYENRPVECKALKCWDTREIENLYNRNRLTRKDLISAIEGLWDLIEDHQKRCNYKTIGRLVKDLDSGKRSAAQRKLKQIIQYDAEIRRLVVSQGGLDPEIVDFLFGRPLTKTMGHLGLKVQQQGKKITITQRSQKIKKMEAHKHESHCREKRKQ